MSSKLEPWMFVEICQRLTAGETLRAICRSTMPDGTLKFPHESTVRLAISQDEEMYTQYACARDLGLDSVAEEIFEIADEKSNDTIVDKDGNEYENKEWVNRSKIRMQARQWYLSKIAPKRYGEQLTLKGDKDAPITVNIIDNVPDV